MSFSQRVLELLKEKNLPKSELARAIGIPYTTLDSMLKRDSDGAKIETVFRIAAHLEVSVEQLVFGEAPSAPQINEEERELVRRFRLLDGRGKRTLLQLAQLEAQSLVSHTEPRRLRRLPVYDAPAAAGSALPPLSDDYTFVAVDNAPERADFGIKISGNSMEPRIADGSVVWVRQTQQLQDGDIGIFLLNGESLCKKLSHAQGKCQLLSLNSAYAPIPVLETDELKVVGKVLTDGR